MNSNKFQARIKKIGAVVFLIFGFLLLSSGVNAQNSVARDSVKNNPRASRRADDSDVSRIARVQGFNDGLKNGAANVRKRNKNPKKTKEYKNGSNGYKIYYGNRKYYKQTYGGGNRKLYRQAYSENKKAYREAYREGFLEGFNKAGDDYSASARPAITVRRKPGIFSRLRRVILFGH